MYIPIKNKKGSIALEFALILPLFLTAVFLLAALLQCLYVYHVAEKALYQTSGILCDYAYFYHRGLMEKGEDALLAQLSGFLPANDQESDDLWERLSGYLDFRNGLERADDLLYQEAANFIFRCCLKGQEHLFDTISFAGSTFFNGDDRVILQLRCDVPLLLPLPVPLLSGFTLTYCLPSRAWMAGDRWWAEEAGETELSVWSLAPLERGKEIRKRFGGNLPEFYPVISRYQDGCATVIKSLDHTAETYQSGKNMKNTLYQMAKKLEAFSGTAGDSAVPREQWIEPGEIRQKKLLLVLPVNPTSAEQEAILFEFSLFCVSCGIMIEIERYQESGGNSA